MSVSEVTTEIKDLGHLGVKQASHLHDGSGFNYQMPPLYVDEHKNPRFPIQRGVFEGGRLAIGATVRVQAEVYLWLDHEWGTPEQRWEELKRLHADVVQQARTIGFDQLYCVLPPEVAKSFGPRLQELGWEQTRQWDRFTLEL